jgi:hypothetical protein
MQDRAAAYTWDVHSDIPSYPDGIHVFWDDEMKGLNGKNVYTGLWIQMPIDERWLLDNPTGTDFFTGVIRSTDSILLSYCSMDYDYVHHAEDFPTNYLSQGAFDRIDEARNVFVALPPDKKKRYVLLKIKPRSGMAGVRLSVREIFIDPEKPFDETTLPFSMFPITTQHPRIPKPSVKWYAQWRVLVHDIASSADEHNRKRGKPDTQPAVSGLFASIESFYHPPPPAAVGSGATNTPSIPPSS